MQKKKEKKAKTGFHGVNIDTWEKINFVMGSYIFCEYILGDFLHIRIVNIEAIQYVIFTAIAVFETRL